MSRAACGVLATLLASSCAPQVIWHGFSPGGEHSAQILTTRGGQRVRLDAMDQATYRGIGPHSFVFSADGRHFAYAAHLPGGWAVVRDGRPGRPWPGLLERTLSFDPRGEHLTYAVVDAGGTHVVFDDQPGVSYDGVASLLTLAGHRAYLARRGDRVLPVVDGVELQAFEAIAELAIGVSPQGRLHAAFLARRSDGWHAVLDGVEGPAWTSARQLRFSPDGSHLAFVARAAGAQSVMLDGVAVATYEHVDGDLSFVGGGPDGPQLLYRIREAGHAAVVLAGIAGAAKDHSTGPPFDEVDAPVVAGDHWGYFGHRGEGVTVVIDGRSLATYEWAGDMVLGPDGHHAFLAERGTTGLVVHDGHEHRVGVVASGTLVLGNQGRSWACLTVDAAARVFRVVADGSVRSSVTFGELRELFGALDDDGSLVLPEDTRPLRGLVAAALDTP